MMIAKMPGEGRLAPGAQGLAGMLTRGSHRWTLPQWTGHARSIALACWLAAVVMTGVMGWSAWRAVDNASEGVDRVVARHEAGIVAKTRDIFIARN